MDKAIQIQSPTGAHLAFVLMAKNDGDQGECVFVPLPKDPAHFTSPEFLFLRRLGAKESGEHKWQRHGDRVSIDLTTGDRAMMDLTAKTLVFNQGARYIIA